MNYLNKFLSHLAVLVSLVFFTFENTTAQNTSSLTGMKSEIISSTQVKVSWEGSISDKSYEVRRREAGSSFWVYNTVSAPTTNKRFTNLKPSTAYEWEVRVIGGKNDAFVSGGKFTTFSNCDLPDGFSVQYSGLTGATLSWNYQNNVEKYAVRIRGIEEDDWQTYYTEYTSLTLNDLLPYTEYEWQVSSYCSKIEGSSSAYSVSQYFSTESYLQLGLNQVILDRVNAAKQSSDKKFSSSLSNKQQNNYVKMINTLGQTVEKFPISYTDSSGDLFIDMNSEPPAGVYFMKMPDNMSSSGQKILVK